MSEHDSPKVESEWPERYQAPTLEPVGAVWELTEAFAFQMADASAQLGPSPFPSDVALKENFATVDVEEILERVATLPIRTWNYKAEDVESRHIGPTAQDFQSAFGVGGEYRISGVDAAGVSLAAVQALCRRLEEVESELERLRAEIAAR